MYLVAYLVANNEPLLYSATETKQIHHRLRFLVKRNHALSLELQVKKIKVYLRYSVVLVHSVQVLKILLQYSELQKQIEHHLLYSAVIKLQQHPLRHQFLVQHPPAVPPFLVKPLQLARYLENLRQTRKINLFSEEHRLGLHLSLVKQLLTVQDLSLEIVRLPKLQSKIIKELTCLQINLCLLLRH